MEALELKIGGMSCQHCVVSVTKTLTAVSGVEKVEIDLPGKIARVWGAADHKDLVAAIEKIGFSAG